MEDNKINLDEKFIEHPLIRPKTMQSRLYQEAMFGRAVGNDLLCVMPTAMGKTNVAILLAAHRLQKYPDSRTMVLAPTRPLVSQHFRTFRKFMNVPGDQMVVLTGMVKPGLRQELYQEKRIIFATPQTIEKDLKNSRLSFRDFSLLVADEAHHSVGKYS